MRGCLFTLLLGAIVVAFAVIVGLPVVAAGLLGAGLSAAGLQADDTQVTVTSNPPTDLLALRADTVRVTATDATFRGLAIASLDLSLGDVRILDRTAGALDGELRGVTVRATGGETIRLDRIVLGGTPDAVTATATVPRAQVEDLVARVVEAETGVQPRSVRLRAPNRLVVDIGTPVTARLAVNAAGNLVVRGDGPLDGVTMVLVRGGEDLPIELTSVSVADDGAVRLTGDLAIGLLG